MIDTWWLALIVPAALIAGFSIGAELVKRKILSVLNEIRNVVSDKSNSDT